VLDDFALILQVKGPSERPKIADFDACLEIMNTNETFHASLKRFTFQCEAEYWHLGSRYDRQIPSCHFQPIQSMAHLEYLTVETPYGLGEAGSFVQDVVAHLPCLVECSVPLSSGPADVTALHILALSCPNLVRLQLPLKTGFVGYDHLFSTSKSHRLQHLTVSEWRAGSYGVDQNQLFLAVRHLNATFPYLRVVNGGFGWGVVMSMLGTLRDMAWAG
jgi:hypothetical protein